ncbi:methylated-DNA--protein-cysteine methyltransferase [Hippoglossus hippoglossus]|uniref:methylated-DNA--protein-cysteine methyltransferase n=1 Tax=Hippoglossus hippoglossus TaxID=8267 RepID=UPI00148BC62E|nr:methylated-DNA--protein-cysteine methyltransferase [Hippoglossus hippoglossus]XP_034464746.1 methylated-DNA--protein-cysteine methyltransferase [Hippoglossus hippoglossus]XP_034464747.1 methylated-DNA--protein-cysteine methyltransferase [Hippoglossus hippoglossus]XP_034464749.1 methylated-DNA--protein-cysteine methyltransferase [Hippoglossus hippoglossus]
MKRASHGHRRDVKDFVQGSEMKKQRESQCTQKTISLLSPLGTIQVSGCENGVHAIQILMDVAPAERSDGAPLSCVVNDSPAETSPELQRCVEWLQAYFSEPQTTGRLPLPAFHHPALQGDAFTSRVLHVLQRDVKFGETVSYKRLAEMAGNPRAVRAVGGAMRRNPVPLLIPCHRVISSSGQSGPYMSGKGDHLKQWLLTHERQRGEG